MKCTIKNQQKWKGFRDGQYSSSAETYRQCDTTNIMVKHKKQKKQNKYHFKQMAIVNVYNSHDREKREYCSEHRTIALMSYTLEVIIKIMHNEFINCKGGQILVETFCRQKRKSPIFLLLSFIQVILLILRWWGKRFDNVQRKCLVDPSFTPLIK